MKTPVYPIAVTAALALSAGLALQPTLSSAIGRSESNAPPTASASPPAHTVPPAVFNPNVFVELAQKAIPSVVNISTSGPAPGSRGRGGLRPEDMFEQFFGPGFGGRFGGPSRQFEPPRSSSLGTGFIIDESGILLTNAHVVDGADEILITFTEDPGEKPTPGQVIGRDGELDIALIRVKTDRKLIALKLGDSDALKVGEYVAAVGNPFGQGHSFTHGVISAKGRNAPGFPLASYIQTDAPINPGNSGGPLLNLQGEVIGINNAIDARAQGIGFAIPANAVRAVLPVLRDGGKIKRGYLGAVIGDLSPELRRQIDLKKEIEAPIVMETAPGGPAFRVGIRPYDVVLSVAGKPVKSAQELTNRVIALPAGERVKVKIRRDDQDLEVDVKLGERPDPRSRS